MVWVPGKKVPFGTPTTAKASTVPQADTVLVKGSPWDGIGMVSVSRPPANTAPRAASKKEAAAKMDFMVSSVFLRMMRYLTGLVLTVTVSPLHLYVCSLGVLDDTFSSQGRQLTSSVERILTFLVNRCQSQLHVAERHHGPESHHTGHQLCAK